MSARARRLIRENLATQHPYLDLGRCGLTDDNFPAELGECAHLETLVLASEWIAYNPATNKWERKESQNQPGEGNNRLAKMPEALQKLEKLKHLFYGDLKGSLRAPNLSILQGLSSLQSLNLAKTQVNDLRPLQGLSSLQSLIFSGTQVNDLRPLQGLSSLQSLDLWFTPVNDLRPLQGLSSLQSLKLERTQVSEVPAWLLQKPELHQLDLRQTLIEHLPHEIISQYNCCADLRAWFRDLAAGEVRNEEIKVMVLGNGRVGKTCVIERLRTGGYVKGQASTHAIRLRTVQAPLPDKQGEDTTLTARFWDFGGQDIYHGTHRIFMQSRALFLLVWDWEGETKPHRPAEEEAAEGYLHQNHVLPHWLDYVRSFGKDSPVIIVQNKIDLHGAKTPPHQAVIDNLYNIEGFYHVSAEQNRKIGGLKEGILDAIQAMPEWQMSMPATWHQARQALRALAAEETDISQEQYQALCESAGVRPISRPALLRYLHNSGVLYHQPDLFHGRIILDQQWVIEAIYSLFDRGGIFWEFLRDDGRFDFPKLHKALSLEKRFDETDSQLALSFMLSSEICYRLNPKKDENHQELAAVYVAPQLLPAQPKAGQKALWPQDGLYLQYRYAYLHQVFIQRFIVRAGHLADPEQVWRQGIWFQWQGNQAVIQALAKPDGPGGYIQVQTDGPGAKWLLDRIRRELDRIHPDAIEYQAWFSLDGENWVSQAQVEEARREQRAQMQCEQGGLVEPEAYAPFFPKWGRDTQEGPTRDREQGVRDLQADKVAALSKEMIAGWRERLVSLECEAVIGEIARYRKDDGVMLGFQHSKLKQDIRDGTIPQDQQVLAWNKLVKAILGTIEEMESSL